jgi:hypothetical protein
VAGVLAVDAGHDPQQGALPRPVRAEHADLGAGQERQRDVFQHHAVWRMYAAEPIHGEDVLVGHVNER